MLVKLTVAVPHPAGTQSSCKTRFIMELLAQLVATVWSFSIWFMERLLSVLFLALPCRSSLHAILADVLISCPVLTAATCCCNSVGRLGRGFCTVVRVFPGALFLAISRHC